MSYYTEHKEYFKKYMKRYQEVHKERLKRWHAWYNTTEKRILYRRKKNIEYRKKNISRQARRYALTGEEYTLMRVRCARCGFCEYPCDIHHIDGKKNNNSKNNLISLCPNCHLGYHRGHIKLTTYE